MQYTDGRIAHIGDKVVLGQDQEGFVVCSIDTAEYSDDYPEKEWSYLKSGVLIKFSGYGIIRYTNPDADLRLLARREQPVAG